MKISITKLLLISFVFIVVIGGTAYLHPRWFGLYATARINTAHAIWDIDPDNSRELVGLANNVFVGEVLSSNGTVFRPTSGPTSLEETTFNVKVVKNIKGRLEGTVTVNQLASFNERTNTYNLIEDDQLLQSGTTYLFVTRTSKDKDWHTLVSKYGDLPFANEQEQQRIVQEFENAYQNEIPYILGGINAGEAYYQNVPMLQN